MKTFVSHDLTLTRIAATPPAMHYDGTQPLSQWQAAARAKLEELLMLPLEYCDDEFTVTGTQTTDS